MVELFGVLLFFFFNDTATTEIYTLSLHDALPIFFLGDSRGWRFGVSVVTRRDDVAAVPGRYGWDGGYGTSWASDPTEEMVADRKSTRLNSSHANISYAVFCLKKKKN